MPKKQVKSKKKKKTKKAIATKTRRTDINRLNRTLIDNFVNLQKVMTNLVTKFDDLSEQISKLLQLFEISARSFAEKLETRSPDIEKDRDFLKKIDTLLSQNKTIARGLTLMDEKMREKLYGPRPTPPRRNYPAPPARQMRPGISGPGEMPRAKPLPKY